MISGYDNQFSPNYLNAFHHLKSEEEETQLRSQALQLSILLANFIEGMLVGTVSNSTCEEKLSVFPYPLSHHFPQYLTERTELSISHLSIHRIGSPSPLPLEPMNPSLKPGIPCYPPINPNSPSSSFESSFYPKLIYADVNATYLNELLTCLAVNGTCTIVEELLGLKTGFVSEKTRRL